MTIVEEDPAGSRRRLWPALLALAIAAAATLLPFAAYAQSQEQPPKTRAEAIELERREKVARLWPESKSPIAEIANGFVERGLLDGVQSGLGGGNGMQFAIGGMRSGQGMAVGVGYRRSDLLKERFAATQRPKKRKRSKAGLATLRRSTRNSPVNRR